THSLEPIDDIPETSEQGLALKFCARNQGRVLFVPSWGRWFIWGSRWHPDDRRAVLEMIDEALRAEAARETKRPEQMRLTSVRTASAVEQIASRDHRLVAVPAQFDSDPWVIGSPLDWINLRGSELTMREQRPADYLTKSLAVAPDFEAS